jgi:hypothetical protein
MRKIKKIKPSQPKLKVGDKVKISIGGTAFIENFIRYKKGYYWVGSLRADSLEQLERHMTK